MNLMFFHLWVKCLGFGNKCKIVNVTPECVGKPDLNPNSWFDLLHGLKSLKLGPSGDG